MEIKAKKVEHIVISLNPEEAMMLKAILNVSHVGVEETYPKSKTIIEAFSQELWDSLGDLDVKELLQ